MFAILYVVNGVIYVSHVNFTRTSFCTREGFNFFPCFEEQGLMGGWGVGGGVVLLRNTALRRELHGLYVAWLGL